MITTTVIYRWVAIAALSLLTSCSSFTVSPRSYTVQVNKYDTVKEVTAACERLGGDLEYRGCTKEIAHEYWIIHTLSNFDCYLHELRHVEQGDYHRSGSGC